MRHRVADGVGDVDRGGALLDRDLHHLGGELHVRRGSRPSGRTPRRPGTRCACATAARAWPLTSSRVVCSWCTIWMSDRRDERVDARALGVPDRLPRRVDVLLAVLASPQITGPWTSRAIACTDSKSPGEVIGKPASMMSTPSRASWWAISSFSCLFSEMPGDCSPSRRVVSKIVRACARPRRRAPSAARPDARLCLSAQNSCRIAPSRSLLHFLQVGMRLRGRHALFPPRGEEEKECKRRRERHAAGKCYHRCAAVPRIDPAWHAANVVDSGRPTIRGRPRSEAPRTAVRWPLEL